MLPTQPSAIKNQEASDVHIYSSKRHELMRNISKVLCPRVSLVVSDSFLYVMLYFFSALSALDVHSCFASHGHVCKSCEPFGRYYLTSLSFIPLCPHSACVVKVSAVHEHASNAQASSSLNLALLCNRCMLVVCIAKFCSSVLVASLASVERTAVTLNLTCQEFGSLAA